MPNFAAQQSPNLLSVKVTAHSYSARAAQFTGLGGFSTFEDISQSAMSNCKPPRFCLQPRPCLRPFIPFNRCDEYRSMKPVRKNSGLS
jgi:hypothetical protein